MTFVPAICTQCGAQIEVDNTHEAGVCKFCGTAFITEKAINNYIIHNTNNNTFIGATVNIVKGEIENFLQMAQFAYESKNYEEALINANKAIEIDINNYIAWKYKTISCGWSSTLLKNKIPEAIVNAKQAIKLTPCDQKETIADEILDVISIQIVGLFKVWLTLPVISQVGDYEYIPKVLFEQWKQTFEIPYISKKSIEKQLEIAKTLFLPSGTSYGEISQKSRFSDNAKKLNNGVLYYDELKLITTEIGNKNEKIKQQKYWDSHREDVPNAIAKNEQELQEYQELLSKYIEERDCVEKEIRECKGIIEKNKNKLFGEGAKAKKNAQEKCVMLEKQKAELYDKISHTIEKKNKIQENITFLENFI